MNFQYPILIIVGPALFFGLLILTRYIFPRSTLYFINLSALKKLPSYKKFQRKQKVLSIMKLLMLFTCITAIGCIVARPYVSFEQDVSSKSADVVIALDVSRSDQPFLESVSADIKNFSTKVQGQNLGLVIIAGKAKALVPPSADHSQVVAVANDLDVMGREEFLAKIGVPEGSAIGDGLVQSAELFGTNSPRQKIILLFSDGISNRGLSIDEVTPYLAVRGIQVITAQLSFDQSLKNNSLENLATQTHGHYMSLASKQDVINAFSQTYRSISAPKAELRYHETPGIFILISAISWCLYIGLERLSKWV